MPSGQAQNGIAIEIQGFFHTLPHTSHTQALARSIHDSTTDAIREYEMIPVFSLAELLPVLLHQERLTQSEPHKLFNGVNEGRQFGGLIVGQLGLLGRTTVHDRTPRVIGLAHYAKDVTLTIIRVFDELRCP